MLQAKDINRSSIKDLISLIFATSRIIHERTRSNKMLCLLSYLQLEVLRYINDNKNLSLKETADYLSVTSASASVLLDRLVGAGQLLRIHDRNDRRLIHFRLTAKGRKTFKQIYREKTKQMREILSMLSNKEIKNLTKILKKIHQSAALKKSNA